MRVLLCGHRSFAARGLVPVLRRAGHEVVCFSRGPVAESEGVVTGPVDALHENPHLRRAFDAVVNYILLKDDAIGPNVAYARSLLQLCRESGAGHLVHISSISSYKASVKLVHEDAEVEDVPERKGSYGAAKAATDHVLVRELPPGMKLSLVRPGFILGPGLINPIIGTAARLPWNRLLVIGNARSRIPVITRDAVNEAVAKVVASPPSSNVEVVLLAAPNSPTRKEFLDVCCTRLGVARGVTTVPVPIWYVVAVGAEAAARVLGQGKLQPFNKLVARLPEQRFDASKTQQRLGMDLSADWANVLAGSLDDQQPNFTLPPPPALPPRIQGRSITFIGFGRIVKQRYLPALKKCGFAGDVRAYDLKPSAGEGGIVIRAIGEARLEPSDLFVVATPGPAHAAAIAPLAAVEGPVLVEKPLCYTADELGAWASFASARRAPVFVCHNYRLKRNVIEMLAHLRRYNPGRLRHASLHFRSPPVGYDAATWLRNERAARTLLMDYALHFLDLACMLGPGETGAAWSIDHVRHELNSQGQTALIEGHLTGNYSVNFLLRQGFGPRRARIIYEFENYSVAIGFFPETFAAYMADDNPWLYKMEAKASRRATYRKVADRLLNRDSDASHGIVLAGAMDRAAEYVEPLRVEPLRRFYEMLFEISRRVYG